MHPSGLIPFLNIPAELEGLRASKSTHPIAKVAQGSKHPGEGIPHEYGVPRLSQRPGSIGVRGSGPTGAQLVATRLQMHRDRTFVSPALVSPTSFKNLITKCRFFSLYLGGTKLPNYWLYVSSSVISFQSQTPSHCSPGIPVMDLPTYLLTRP